MAATKGPAWTIASGATVSDGLFVGASQDAFGGLAGFVMPATFTGASVTFQVSVDDSTYQALYDSSNNQISITVSASRSYAFKQDVRSCLQPWPYVKIVSASGEGAARTITAIYR